MNLSFIGPFPFEAKLALARGRAALAAVGAALRAKSRPEPVATRLDQPGLYIVLSGDPPAILGFWIVFGPSFLDDGPAGAPERVAPYAAGLLDAATEEVWWRTLRVKQDEPGRWSPLIVLDWPPALAVRSLAAPPGVAAAPEPGPSQATVEEESWLDLAPRTPSAAPPPPVEPPRSVSDPWAGLPEARGLVSVIRGELRFTASLHTGRWEVVPPAALGVAEGGAIPLQTWIEAASAARGGQEELAEAPALWLPGGRVARPLAGWLTRALEPWPARPEELAEGVLSAREVGTKWKALVARALGSTVAVLLGVGGLAGAVRLAAEPRPQPLPVTPLPAPQPAMSVCSADHLAFVSELRCQVATLAVSDNPDTPICGDAGSPGAPPDAGADLQAAYCGLLDRELDGWTGNRAVRDATYNFGALALSQACFNVLGRPYAYTQPGGFSGGRAVADPERFLRDPDLGIASLVEADTKLRAACDRVRSRTEARVEGSIFATHLGGPAAATFVQGEDESATLRRALAQLVRGGLSGEATRCFDVGVREGVPWPSYAGVCGPGDPADEALQQSAIWRRLGGEGGTGDVVGRYVSARFGLSGPAHKTQSELWRCHLALIGVGEELKGWARGLWDLVLPVPRVYNVRGAGADSQLVLDAGMRAFESGLDAGVCWSVVKRRLTGYTPVHPLLEELDADGWPSVEQRLCGQTCASAFHLTTPEGGAWLTPKTDLRLCLNDAPPTTPPDFGQDALDTLRMPWNGTSWHSPSAAQICAFNLVAQGYFSADEGPGGKAPVQWAGETAPGSRIAGGPNGLAADAVAGMQRYGAGSGWSVGRCSFVATQCFTELLLEITGDPGVERYEWLPRWNSAIAALSATKTNVLAEKHPWCAPLQPYLGDTTDLAQLDTPCRRGVDEARAAIERAATRYAAGEDAP